MKTIIKWFLYVLLAGSLIVISLIGRIDRTPLYEQPFYHDMMRELDTIHFEQSGNNKIKMGWGKYNITPGFEMPMAGYKPRDHFDSVHDSLYVRIIEIDNGRPVFIITADLLLFPPSLKEKIEMKLSKLLPNAFLFFSATHTHNGLGGWDNSFAGQFVAGRYHDEWVNQVSEGITDRILQIHKQTLPGSVSYFEADATGYAANRLADDAGTVDATLRGFKLIRTDSSKAIFTTFSAHATSISKKLKILSGDYPAELNTELEKNGYHFSMFAAGMVGSHRLDGFSENDFELTQKAGKALAGKIISEALDSKKEDAVAITMSHIPVQHGPAQLRLENNLHLRDWAFRLLLRKLEGEITVLQIGNIVLLGTPCDFSGELSVNGKLDSVANSKGKHLIITSFNGNYTGYITEDDHYDRFRKEEVMALNWVGPHFGQYYQEMVRKILIKD